MSFQYNHIYQIMCVYKTCVLHTYNCVCACAFVFVNMCVYVLRKFKYIYFGQWTEMIYYSTLYNICTPLRKMLSEFLYLYNSIKILTYTKQFLSSRSTYFNFFLLSNKYQHKITIILIIVIKKLENLRFMCFI